MIGTVSNFSAREILGLAMIAVGIHCGVVQLAGDGARLTAATQTAAAATLPADMPRIENAKVVTQVLTGTLDSTMRQILASSEQPKWVGYVVEQIAGERSVCCDNYGDGSCGTCRLENDHSWTSGASKNEGQAGGTVKLESGRQIAVLYRLEDKKVVRIRLASDECTLDAGGLPFVWLTGVKEAESVALLEAYVHGEPFASHGEHGVGHGALSAIALHAGEAADRAMQSFVAPDQPEGLRRQAAFWLGAARGESGLRILRQMAKSDPSSEVRAQVAFALSVSHDTGADE